MKSEKGMLRFLLPDRTSHTQNAQHSSAHQRLHRENDHERLPTHTTAARQRRERREDARHILLLKYRQIPASEDLVFVGREERYDAMLLPRVEPATLRPQPVGHGLFVPGGRSGEHSLLAADRAPQVAR
jgi:hypothetical protein